jgi:PAS domain S-box-containing protein
MPGKLQKSEPTQVSRLRAENKRLRARLAQAEEAQATLAAIQRGAVDAVLVAGPEGQQVYTLEGAERPYRLLLETLNAGALTLAPNGVILYANAQAAVLLGVGLEELMGVRLADHVCPEDLPYVRDLLQRARDGMASGEVRFQLAGLPPLVLHLALRGLNEPDLQVVCGVLTDLTERKRAEAALAKANATLEAQVAERTAALQSFIAALRKAKAELEHANSQLARANTEVQETNAELEIANAELEQEIEQRTAVEEALRQSEARYRSLVELAPDAILVHAEGRYVLANQAAATVFGVSSPEALVGRDVLDLVHPDDRQAVGARVAHLYAGGVIERRDLRLLRLDGTAVAVETAATRVNWAGKPAIQIVLRDMTERRRAETQLKATLAAKEGALADRDALLREVHHRVKNNLQMLCDLIYLQLEGMPDRDQHQDLQDAYSRIYAIARLHEQLYQSMQAGRIDLGEYLGRLAAGFENLFPGIPVRLEARDQGLTLDLDRAIHVGLIVNELVTNALKHAFPKGQPGEVVIALRTVRDQMQVQVRDNGRGLPREFHLGHAKSLGLRTVYIIANRLNAAVTVENRNGTSFTITFPLRADVPVEPRPE